MTFPLRNRPAADYHEAPRSFGSSRDGGSRKHAGCDLYAQPGDGVLAIEAGTVTRGCYPFYDAVFALEITSPLHRVIRYGEISGAAKGIRLGSVIEEGQVIGYVGKMKAVEQSMLHLEAYAGMEQGPLTDKEQPPFMRRSDLMNPTELLDSAELGAVPVTS